MFTGIIESQGIIKELKDIGTNREFWIRSGISSKLKVEQSLAHDGVCLTIEQVKGNKYKVTAVKETLEKTTLNDWQIGQSVNLERSLKLNNRLDGHLLQGHVDVTGICTERIEKNGSWEFRFSFPGKFAGYVIEKGSITINGISLTAFNITKTSIDVAIIPFTFDHTNMNSILPGNRVNLEFDMVGKYLQRHLFLMNELPKPNP